VIRVRLKEQAWIIDPLLPFFLITFYLREQGYLKNYGDQGRIIKLEI
jgi:hypothetical protein